MSKKVSKMTSEQRKKKREHNLWYYRTIRRPQRKKIREIRIQNRRIPREIKGYIAGFIDGEGSISLLKKVRKNRGTTEIGVGIAVHNTNKTPLELIGKYFPGQIYGRQRAQFRYLYTFVFSSKFESLYNTCYQLIPFAIIKKQHLKLVMKYCEQRIEATSKWGYKHPGNSYTQKDWDVVDQMKKLNIKFGRGK